MITNIVPNKWQDLQEKVGEILSECGFDAKTEQEIDTVRGKVEIDVIAKEEINGRVYSIICECKRWKSNIPQNVIHSFRTVMDDLGSNKGYIITTSDFQPGSRKAVENTNIELLNWEEFQDIFLESWYLNYFCRYIQDNLKIPNEYMWVEWFDSLNKEDRSLYFDIKNKLLEIEQVKSHLIEPKFAKFLQIDTTLKNLPLSNSLFNYEEYFGDLPNEILTETAYKEFVDIFLIYTNKIILEFEALNKKYEK